MSLSSDVELYFIPTSYYCQRARLALIEKGIKYKETIVWALENEQNKPWFIKISPNGEVPVLRIGDRYYNESEKIVNAVDKLQSRLNVRLVPEKETQEGKQVYYWRRSINEVQIPQLTFGLAIFPECAPVPPVGRSTPNAQGVRERFDLSIAELKKLKVEHPELADYYDRKITETREKSVSFFDKELLLEILADLDQRMPQLETQVHAMTTRSSVSGGGSFFCGRSFTAADINLCVLIGRFRSLGLLPRYVNRRKFPCLYAYWHRIQQRPSVQKVVIKSMVEMEQIAIRRKMISTCKLVAALSIAAGTAWLVYRFFFKNG